MVLHMLVYLKCIIHENAKYTSSGFEAIDSCSGENLQRHRRSSPPAGLFFIIFYKKTF